MRIEQHQRGEGTFRNTLESLISVASRAAEIFERSKTEQKRQLIAFVFSNLKLGGRKLEFSLRSPFDLMIDRPDYASWLAFLDTVRTERFDQVLALRPTLGSLPSVRPAAQITSLQPYRFPGTIVAPLQSDLAMVALLGIPHVERDGHPLLLRLNHLTAEERAAALAAHIGAMQTPKAWLAAHPSDAELGS